MDGKVIVSYARNDTREALLVEVFPNGHQGVMSEQILRIVENFFDLRDGSLSGYVVALRDNNMLIRKNAVFGLGC